MKGLIALIVKSFVDNHDAVEFYQIDGEKTTVSELRVELGDLGKVIGKNGQTARSI